MKAQDLIIQDKAKLFEKINRLSPHAVYIFDLLEGRMVWFNERVQELYGYSLAELRAMGENYHEKVMHPEDVEVLRNAVKKAREMKDGEIMPLEYRFKDRRQRYHWIKDQVTPFSRGDDGRVHFVLGVAMDLDDRKAHEETLRKTIDKLNLCLSAGNMGTWEWDVTANKLHWDPQMYRLHGLPVDTSLEPIVEINKRMLKEDLIIVNERVEKSVKARSEFFVSYRIVYGSGDIRHVKCYGKFLTDPNENRMYGVAWDSTDEMLTEREIEDARAQLISTTKMAALGEMSAGIAHEINNPLTVIQARAFQLSQMIDQQKLDPEKIQQAAESISRTADKIARIVRSLRSFAREGTFDPFEVIAVKDIIEDTLELCRARFYNNGIDIEIKDIPPELDVECRVVQIEQVLLNLLNNSFDAIQNLEEKWIRIAVADLGKMIEITITDSGTGIPAEVVEKMMLPFYTTKEVGKGTGLGLSISSGIMRSHQGELQFANRESHTTFIIRLPRSQEESPS